MIQKLPRILLWGYRKRYAGRAYPAVYIQQGAIHYESTLTNGLLVLHACRILAGWTKPIAWLWVRWLRLRGRIE